MAKIILISQNIHFKVIQKGSKPCEIDRKICDLYREACFS